MRALEVSGQGPEFAAQKSAFEKSEAKAIDAGRILYATDWLCSIGTGMIEQ